LLAEYQARLAAQDSLCAARGLQALDAAGKDGTIKHVMSGVNPQGVSVVSFKVPSAEDLQHDFLWRYQRALPQRGTIGIFNRSHYEECWWSAFTRSSWPPSKCRRRPGERGSGRGATRPSTTGNATWWKTAPASSSWLLNVSKEEQRRRFLDRIDEPQKNWNSRPPTPASANTGTTTRPPSRDAQRHQHQWAPWHVIPADHKWFAHLSVAAVLVDALMDIDPRYPSLSEEQRRELAEAKKQLEAKLQTKRSEDGRLGERRAAHPRRLNAGRRPAAGRAPAAIRPPAADRPCDREPLPEERRRLWPLILTCAGVGQPKRHADRAR